jgi:Xaa-Pro aminopeptidase
LRPIPTGAAVFRGSEIFPPEEFAARRAQIMAQIGEGVAIVLGTTEPPGEMPFRQNSQFFYLSGVAEPTHQENHHLPESLGNLGGPTLEPGRIFTIEPEMRIGEDHTGIRLEDMILITPPATKCSPRSCPSKWRISRS